MKTKTTNTTKTPTPSVVLTSTAPVPAAGFTIGLDLGDRSHYVCVLEATGQITLTERHFLRRMKTAH